MTTPFSHYQSRRWRATGQAGARLGRLATVLAAVISGLLASAAAATAAFANPVPVGGAPSPRAGPGHRPGDQHQRHDRLAGRPDRGRGRPGRRGCGRVPGPQTGRPPSRHRHHPLMRPSATAHHASLTVRAQARTVRQARARPESGPRRTVTDAARRPGH